MKATHVLIALALTTAIGCAGTSPTAPTAGHASLGGAPTIGLDLESTSAAIQGGGPKGRKVKSGTITVLSPTMGGSVTLSGPRFDITGDWTDGGSLGCQPCTSGLTSIWTSAAFAGSRGSATVDGVRYDTVYLSGAIELSGKALVPASGSSIFTVAYPFAIDESSGLVGYASNPWIAPAEELFRVELRGAGTATIELATIALPGAANIYTARGISYTF